MCFSMMFFAGCGNNNSTNNGRGVEATADPDHNVGNDGDSVMEDVGEGAKDVIDGAEDAVDGAANGTKRVIDGVTDDDTDDTGMRDNDGDTNNSVTSGKNR